MSLIGTLIMIQVRKAFVISQEECGLDVSSEPGSTMLCWPAGLTPCIDTGFYHKYTVLTLDINFHEK